MRIDTISTGFPEAWAEITLLTITDPLSLRLKKNEVLQVLTSDDSVNNQYTKPITPPFPML